MSAAAGGGAAAAPTRRRRSNELARLIGSPGAGGQTTRGSRARRNAAGDEAQQALENDDEDTRTRSRGLNPAMMQLASRGLLPGQRGERWLATNGAEDDRPTIRRKLRDVLDEQPIASNRIMKLKHVIDFIEEKCLHHACTEQKMTAQAADMLRPNTRDVRY